MGLIIFKPPQYKVFNYKPRYWNERKEELDDIIDRAKRQEAGEYVPGDYIKGGFKKMRITNPKKVNRVATIIKWIGVFAACALVLAAFYFAKTLEAAMDKLG